MEKSAERTFNEALEFAKTWFVLAEILAVLAGLFLIASSGYITPPYEISNFYGNIFSICKDYESIGRTYAAQNFTFYKCRTGFENDFGVFTYQRIHPKAYGGFESKEDPKGMAILIAFPERALVDFFYLNLSKFDTTKPRIFSASYRFQNCDDLSAKRLREFAQCFESKKLVTVVDSFLESMQG